MSAPLALAVPPGGVARIAGHPRGAAAPQPVAVSLTPLALEADGRAFRIACELADIGFRSIVVEGQASRQRFWSDRIEVLACAGATGHRAGTAARGGALRHGRGGRVGELCLYAAFRCRDYWRYCVRPRRIVPPADLYYLHSFELHRAVAAGAAPIIYDAHDFYRGIEPLERQLAFDRRRLRPFFDQLEDRLVASAAGFVTVSVGVAGLLHDTFRRRPVVIRNCHDGRFDRATERDLRARLGLSPSDRLCVVVGNRKRGMAVDVAVAALAILPDHVHLAFVGRFYDADRDRVRGHPAAHRLHFGHCVAPNEVVPFISAADLGMVLYEHYSENYRLSLPNGFFQILAAGLPLVRGYLPEIEAVIAGRPVGVCLDHVDAEALAEAIRRCLDTATRLRPAAAAVGRELSWEREAVHLHSLIDRVLPGQFARSPGLPPAG